MIIINIHNKRIKQNLKITLKTKNLKISYFGESKMMKYVLTKEVKDEFHQVIQLLAKFTSISI